jgi:hypothetical protein
MHYFFFTIGPFACISSRGKPGTNKVSSSMASIAWIQALLLHDHLILQHSRIIAISDPPPHEPIFLQRIEAEAAVDAPNMEVVADDLSGWCLDDVLRPTILTSDRSAFLLHKLAHDITAGPRIEASHVPDEDVLPYHRNRQTRHTQRAF